MFLTVACWRACKNGLSANSFCGIQLMLLWDCKMRIHYVHWTHPIPCSSSVEKQMSLPLERNCCVFGRNYVTLKWRLKWGHCKRLMLLDTFIICCIRKVLDAKIVSQHRATRITLFILHEQIHIKHLDYLCLRKKPTNVLPAPQNFCVFSVISCVLRYFSVSSATAHVALQLPVTLPALHVCYETPRKLKLTPTLQGLTAHFWLGNNKAFFPSQTALHHTLAVDCSSAASHPIQCYDLRGH